jgi:hypothetical protein
MEKIYNMDSGIGSIPKEEYSQNIDSMVFLKTLTMINVTNEDKMREYTKKNKIDGKNKDKHVYVIPSIQKEQRVFKGYSENGTTQYWMN